MNAPTPLLGQAIPRVDAPDKTRGAARYAAEFTRPGMLHAALVQSPAASGTLRGLDLGAAQAMPGVVAILDASDESGLPRDKDGRQAVIKPLLDGDRIFYSGQTIAVVVADTLERATAATGAVRASIDASAPVAQMRDALSHAWTPDDVKGGADTTRGDPDTALAGAPHRIEATYTTPMEFHNPMEPHATIAEWQGDRLTVWTATQGISGAQRALAGLFGLPAKNVRVICPYVGGGFGCKGNAWPPAMLAAMAARKVGRPVSLVLTRPQMYMNNGHRPATIQTVSLGADADGTLRAIRHTGYSQMSDRSLGAFTESFAVATRMAYRCPAVATAHRDVATSYGLPTYMRAPGEASGMFALESAMDELAAQLRMDPIALRLKNDAEQDGNLGKPFASKALRQCYEQGAARFGWSRRTLAPRSMRQGNMLVGIGMATSTYPTNRQPAHARVVLLPDGSAVVQSGTQDLGTGTYTIMTQVAGEVLGLPPGRVRAELGDTDFPPAPVSGGSMTTASVQPAVLQAARAARARVLGLALSDGGEAFRGLSPADLTLRNGQVVSARGAAVAVGALMAARKLPRIEAESAATLPADASHYSRHAFGAQFAEVHVDEDYGIIRVARYLGVFGVGRLLNQMTGRSQLYGGITYGIGMALLEGARPDQHTARIMNDNLSEYLVPVNADIPAIEVITIDDPDMITDPLGAKGIGELPMVGVAPAIANAVFHATGKRVRDLPIRMEDLIDV